MLLQVEKHIRKNKLTAGTFSEQVGASSHADTESTDREARKLAFFLYWNIKPTFTRYAVTLADEMTNMCIRLTALM